MEYPPKSPRIFNIATTVCAATPRWRVGIFFAWALIGLAGCADTAWPTWLTGEPDETILHAPRVVGTPSGRNDETWPNLGNVPSKPKDFSVETERQKQIRKLEKARAEAEAIKERVDQTPMPPTLASPEAPSTPSLLLPSPSMP